MTGGPVEGKWVDRRWVEGKWRPTLGMIVFAVLTSVIALPLVGLFFFRIFENQLVRQTESELIAQSAVLSAVLAREVDDRLSTGLDLGMEQPADARSDPSEPYHAVAPILDLASDDLLGPRPEARPAAPRSSR